MNKPTVNIIDYSRSLINLRETRSQLMQGAAEKFVRGNVDSACEERNLVEFART